VPIRFPTWPAEDNTEAMNAQDARPISLEALMEMLFGGGPGPEGTETPEVLRVSELRPREAPRVVDLRPRAAFEAGHIPGSSRLGFEEIDVAFLRPPRWRSLIVVAEDAIRADDGARMLRGHGHHARGLSVGIGRYPGPWERGAEQRPVWEPSPLVERWIDGIPPGRACDLACGSGRDSVYMAMRGHEVTAIDILPDALEQGARLADRHEVRVRFVCDDVEARPDCWTESWSVINVQRFLHRATLARMRGRLAGGGHLLYETFLEQQARSGKKPRSPAFLLRSGELLHAAAGLEVLYYREGTTNAGDSTAALVARKGGELAPG
jgi:SAM-dependent methyltransferase